MKQINLLHIRTHLFKPSRLKKKKDYINICNSGNESLNNFRNKASLILAGKSCT